MTKPSREAAEPSDYYYYDCNNNMFIPEFNLTVCQGESVAILGVKGTDVSSLYDKFNQVDPLKQRPKSVPLIKYLINRKIVGVAPPVVQCVTRNITLFPKFSAYDNFTMAEKIIIPQNRKKIISLCNSIKQQFGILSDFNTPLKYLKPSEIIIIDVVRAYISNADTLVFDNIISLLETEDRNIFISLVKVMLARGNHIIYLTTKWENAVQIASRIIVILDNNVLGEVDTESVKNNPQHLLYLISGRRLIEQYNKSSQTADMLNMLYTGAEYIAENNELSDVLSFVTKNVSDVLNCSTASIYLRDENTSQIHRFTNKSNLSDISLSEKLIESRLTEGQKYSLFYSSTENLNFDSFFINGHGDVKTLLCMTIFSKQKVQGLLSVTFNEYVVYDEQQVLYLKSFCKEISIIIETSRLMGSSVLLQESNHRIKNNLQIIINLISMQRMQTKNNSANDINDALDSIINRIQIIATVHEILSSKHSSESSIDLQKIIKNIVQKYEFHDIQINLNSEDILISYTKATSISMIINELITNSIKYAFSSVSEKKKIINISCSRNEAEINITVSDNGIGISDDINFDKSPSIGFSIIRAIVKIDLRGSIRISNNGNGTSAEIAIPLVM